MTVRARLSTSGMDRLVQTISNRANLLGTENVRRILDARARALVDEFKKNIESFTPGTVKDLTEKYKIQKAKRWGRVYPILDASGSMIDGMRIRLVGPPWVFKLTFTGYDANGSSNAVKAEAHIRGLGRNPQRDFTTISSGFRTGTLDAVSAAFQGG